MSNPTTSEIEHWCNQQAIEVRQAQRVYARALENFQHGSRKVVSDARAEISRLRFERDEARLKVERERERLRYFEAQRAQGFTN